jgi:hypothetical protein
MAAAASIVIPISGQAQLPSHPTSRRPAVSNVVAKVPERLVGAVGIESLVWGSDTGTVNRALALAGYKRQGAPVLYTHDRDISDGTSELAETYMHQIGVVPATFRFAFSNHRLSRVGVIVHDNPNEGVDVRRAYPRILRTLIVQFGAPSQVVNSGLRQAMWTGSHTRSLVTLAEANTPTGKGEHQRIVMLNLFPLR